MRNGRRRRRRLLSQFLSVGWESASVSEAGRTKLVRHAQPLITRRKATRTIGGRATPARLLAALTRDIDRGYPVACVAHSSLVTLANPLVRELLAQPPANDQDPD
jgi:hypothetical protein